MTQEIKLTRKEICVLQAALFYMQHVDGMTKEGERVLDRLYKKVNEERQGLGEYQVWKGD